MPPVDDNESVDEDDEDDDDDDELDDAEFERLAQLHQGRGPRKSIAAEQVEASDKDWSAPVHPKSDAQREQIRAAVSKAFMFSALPPEGLRRVLDAFAGPHELLAGTKVISQGAEVTPGEPGLYVLAEGVLDVFKAREGTSAPGDKVFTYTQPGQCFGELALLYNCPRAATVVARDPCVLWSIDRDTFNHCVRGAQMAARASQEEFLASVEILKGLSSPDRNKLVDVLEARPFDDAELIITEGHRGDEFFILQRGRAHASIVGRKVKDYGPGDYFGELALVKRVPRQASVFAVGSGQLLVLDGESFRRLLGPLTDVMAERSKSYTTPKVTRVMDSMERSVDGDIGAGVGALSSPRPWAKAAASSLKQNPPPQDLGRLDTGSKESPDAEDNGSGDDYADSAEMEANFMVFGGSAKKRSTAVAGISSTCQPTANWQAPVFKKSKKQSESIRKFLKKTFMFAALPPQTLDLIVNAMQGPLQAPAGHKIITQGGQVHDDEVALYVLEKGFLEVFRADESMKPPGDNIGSYSQPGDCFGELALLYDCPRAATVMASSESVLWGLDRETFSHLVKGNRIQMRQECEKLLQGVDIFQAVSSSELDRLIDVAQLRVYQQGDRVIKQGEKGDEFFLVQRGKLTATSNGRKVKEYKVGDYFGELALMRQAPRQADVVVTETPTHLLMLDGRTYRRLLGNMDNVMAKRARDYKHDAQNRMGPERAEKVRIVEGFQPEFVPKTAMQRALLEENLSIHYLFVHLEPETLSQIVDAMRGPTVFESGTDVFCQGDMISHSDPGLFVMEKGRATVSKLLPGRQKPSKIFTYETSGTIFGEVAVLYDEPRSASVTSHGCTLWSLSKEAFDYFVQGSHYEQRLDTLKSLEGIELLEELSVMERMRVADVVMRRVFQKGEKVVRAGDFGKEFFMVEDGEAMAVRQGEEVARYGAGDFFGELALLGRGKEKRKADIVAYSSELMVWVVGKADFKRLLQPALEAMAQHITDSGNMRSTRTSISGMRLSMGTFTSSVSPDMRASRRPGFQRLGVGLQTKSAGFSNGSGLNTGDDDSSDEEVAEEDMVRWLAFVRKQGRRCPVLCDRWHPSPDFIVPNLEKTKDQKRRIKAVLDESSLFVLLPSADIQLIVNAFRGPVHYKSGQILCRQGDSVDSDEPAIFVLENGEVQIYSADHGSVFPGFSVGMLDQPGSSFGEAALLHNSPRPTTMVAVEPSSFWQLDRTTALYLIKQGHSRDLECREKLLASVDVLAPLSAEERSLLAECMYTRVCDQGEQIICKGDLGLELFMLEEGSAFVVVDDKRVHEYVPGDYFGELALLNAQARAADIFADSSPTRLAVIHVGNFRSVIGPLETIMTERAQAYKKRGGHQHRNAGPVQGQYHSQEELGARPSKPLSVEEQKHLEWVCKNAACRFQNLGRMEHCLSCGQPRQCSDSGAATTGLPIPATPEGKGTCGLQSGKSLALGLPSEKQALALLHGAAGGQLANETSSLTSPRPTAVAPAQLCAVSASRLAQLAALLGVGGGAGGRPSRGLYLACCEPGAAGGGPGGGAVASEVGVVQGRWPLAPGESFKVALVARGTFGEVGLGLAPPRSLADDSAAAPAAVPGRGSPPALPAAMVGWAVEEMGFHGDHGRWWRAGKSQVVSPPWAVEDVIECGLTSRGHPFFARNGEKIAEARGFWPIAHAYPTVTLRSQGAEVAVCLQGVSEKVLPGTKQATGMQGNSWSLLSNFKTASVSGASKRGGVGLSWFERWFGHCGDVVPAGGCCSVETA